MIVEEEEKWDEKLGYDSFFFIISYFSLELEGIGGKKGTFQREVEIFIAVVPFLYGRSTG